MVGRWKPMLTEQNQKKSITNFEIFFTSIHSECLSICVCLTIVDSFMSVIRHIWWFIWNSWLVKMWLCRFQKTELTSSKCSPVKKTIHVTEKHANEVIIPSFNSSQMPPYSSSSTFWKFKQYKYTMPQFIAPNLLMMRNISLAVSPRAECWLSIDWTYSAIAVKPCNGMMPQITPIMIPNTCRDQ